MEAYELIALIKSLHIIFVVTWFAGLFYIVRLFVNHNEASEKPEPDRSILMQQYQRMERPLWKGITWPSMVLAATFGTWLFFLQPALIHQSYMHIKLTLVVLLIAYHMLIHTLYVRYQKNEVSWTSFALRVFNEVASVFLVSVVITVEFANSLNWKYLVGGIVFFCLLLWYVIVQFNKKRKHQ